MKRNIISALLFCSIAGTASGTTTEGYWTGDVNGDTKVDMADVAALTSMLKGEDNVTPYKYDREAADMNGDKTITLDDMALLVDMVLGKTTTSYQKRDAVNIPIGGTGTSFDVKKQQM